MKKKTPLTTTLWVLALLITTFARGGVAAAQCVENQCDQSQVTTPEHRRDMTTTVSYGVFVDGLDLGQRRFGTSDTEIELLDERVLDQHALGTTVNGGFTLGPELCFLRVLRLDPIRITAGGASPDRPWRPLESQGQGVEVRPSSLGFLRLGAGLGLQARLGPVTLFAMARVDLSLYLLGVEVRHESLGRLGTETASDTSIDVSTELGLAFRVSEVLELSLGWRAFWVGTPGYGLSLAFSFGPASQR